MPNYLALLQPNGEMPERLNGPVSKTGVGATPPGVQIPLSPPSFQQVTTNPPTLQTPFIERS
jgi:hypothetical protein